MTKQPHPGMKKLSDDLQRCQSLSEMWECWRRGYPKDIPHSILREHWLAFQAGALAVCERMTTVPDNATEADILKLIEGIYGQAIENLEREITHNTTRVNASN